MEKGVRQLIGSEARDIFRWGHKQMEILPYFCTGGDIDFVLTCKYGIIAIIDYKTISDTITWTEEIIFDDLNSEGFLIYIVRGYIHTTLEGESIFELIKMNFPQNSIFSTSKDEILGILLEDFHKLKVFRYIKKNNKIIEKLESNDFIEWELKMRKKQNEIIKYRNEHYGKIKEEGIVRVVCDNCGFIFNVSEPEIISNTIICKCPECGSNACDEFEEYIEFKKMCEERKKWEEEEERKYLEDIEIE